MSKRKLVSNPTPTPTPSIPGYTDEFLRIAEHVEKTGEYLLNIRKVWKTLDISPKHLEPEYTAMRKFDSSKKGYHRFDTTNAERVLALLFLHSIILSGDSLK